MTRAQIRLRRACWQLVLAGKRGRAPDYDAVAQAGLELVLEEERRAVLAVRRESPAAGQLVSGDIGRAVDLR